MYAHMFPIRLHPKGWTLCSPALADAQVPVRDEPRPYEKKDDDAIILALGIEGEGEM
jgi:hypothetical protein